MSDSFYKFLSNSGNGTGISFKSYAHATGMYVRGNMARMPKLGFLYFVAFDINTAAVKDVSWLQSQGNLDIGLLAKTVDLPKFKISTETINQYNRKTNVQTKLNYDPVSIVFHDDNSEITNGLWKNYYSYYFADGRFRNEGLIEPDFANTKYSTSDNAYGLDNKQTEPFFRSISIFVLHQGRFTQMTLANPLITAWDHDQLDQANGTKILQNKMTVTFDEVTYYQGQIEEEGSSAVFKAKYYDNLAGPNKIGGTNDIQRPSDIFGPRWEPQPIPPPNYPTPRPAGQSVNQLNKSAEQARGQFASPGQIGDQATALGRRAPPVYNTPRPIGSGTFGLGQRRPGGIGIGGISVWYGAGGLHGKAVINAGPVRLVLKK
jgi:hypothetical protein